MRRHLRREVSCHGEGDRARHQAARDRRLGRRLRARRDERGAVTVLVTLLMTVLLGIAALVVDLGMHRVGRADMQSLADVASLDVARELDGRSAATLDALMPALLAAVLDRNKATFGSDSEPPTLSGEVGILQADGSFQPVSGSAVPTAVRVTASTDVTYAFSGVTGVAQGDTSRQAIAVAQEAACFQLGSYAASIAPYSAEVFGDLMEQLIGQSTVGMVGYNGLATADVLLLDMVHAPSIEVGTVEELLSLPGLTVGELYLAMAHVLSADGHLAEAQVLNAASASAVADIVINVGDLLGLGTSTDAALQTRFNALDLLIGAAFLADGENLILHNLQSGVPSVGVTDTDFSIIERPRRACDDVEAQTAQVRFTSIAKLALEIPLIKTAVVDLRLIGADGKPDGKADLFLDIDIAGARGRLTDVTCDPMTFEADIWTDAAKVSLAGSVRVEGTVEVTLPDAKKPTKVPVTFTLALESDASKPASTSAQHVGPVTYPPQDWDDPVSAPQSPAILPYISVRRLEGSLQSGPVTVDGNAVETSVLDALVEPLLDEVMPAIALEFAVVNPFIDNVNATLGPLTSGMGLTLAGADFFGLPYPTCGQPALRG